MPTASLNPAHEDRLAPAPFKVPRDHHSADFGRLRRLLQRPGHFQLVIAQFNDPRYRDDIIAAVSPTDSGNTGGAAVWSLPEQPDLLALQTGLPERTRQVSALHLVGLDHWLAVSPGPVLQGFNERREGIAAGARLTIVLWLAPEQVRPFAEQAPDLWAWRAAVLDFSLEPQERLAIEWEPLRDRTLPDAATARRRLATIDAYLQNAPAIQSTADLQLEAASLHYVLADWDGARRRTQDALSRYREMGNEWGAVAALDTIAELLETLGQLDGALRIRLEEQLPLVTDLGDRQEEVAALNRIGVILLKCGQSNRALRYLHRALRLAREIGDRRGEGSILGDIGNACAYQGKQQTAITFYEQALEVSRQIGDLRGQFYVLGNLGNAWATLGDQGKAIAFYEQARESIDAIGDRRGEANALGNLGHAWANLGDQRKAIGFYDQQLAIVRELGDRRGEANALGNLGNAWANLGDQTRANGFYEQQSAIVRKLGMEVPGPD